MSSAIDPDSPLSAVQMQALLGPGTRYRLEIHESIDSTNSALKRQAAGGPIDGLVIATETQTAGRGRHGRAWVDRPGGSLLFSVGWATSHDASRLSGLTLAVGVALCHVLEAQGLSGVQLKWPNDLVHRFCKLG